MLSDLDFDLKRFGNILLNIRNNNGITQKTIRSNCGIHPDTIKNIEYGLTLPSTDSLNRLGNFYGINLFNILEECRFENHEIINDLTEKLDEISYRDDLIEIESITYDINKFLKDHDQLVSIKVTHKLKQIEILSELIRLKNKNDVLNIMVAVELCITAIKLSHPNFSIAKIKESYYSLIEYRILLILSFWKTRMKEHTVAIELTKYIITNLEHHIKSNPLVSPLLLQAYYFLSYQYFLINDDEKVITVCDQGITLCKKMYNNKFMPNLLFRKGISEYYLKDDHHLDTLKKCLTMLEMNGEISLLNKYRKTLEEKYKIIIESYHPLPI